MSNRDADRPSELSLVANGKPAATIVIPERADEWTRRAAEWVRDHLADSSGARLQIVAEDQTPSGTLIAIGHTRLAEKAGIKADGLKWDGCRLVARERTLYLLGRDESLATADRRDDWHLGSFAGAKGTCRAAVTFLEDFVGVRWFLPVPQGVLIPKKDNIAVPADLDKTVIPAFAFCHGRYPYGIGTPACIANNYRTAIKLLTYGGHPYYVWLPVDKYFDKHPEYFALINGKRTRQGNHLCSSNPDVRKILLEGIRKDFDKGYDWVALGQEDGYRACECPECEKMDDYMKVMGPARHSLTGAERTWPDYLERFRKAPCERLLSLHRWIIDECRKSHPRKKVHMLIYWPSLIPGTSFDTRCDNLVGEVAFYNDPHELAIIDMWKDKVHALSVMVTWFDLTTGKGTMGVMMTPQEVAERVRTYRRKGVIGMYGIHEANWGLQGPCYYVMGKMVGNPDLDWKDLMDEYCVGLYGKAAKAMKAFFDLLYTRSVCGLGYQWQVRELGSAADRHLLLYPTDFLRELEILLAKAEVHAETDSEGVRKLVALTRLHLDYLKRMTNALTAYRTYNAAKTADNLDRLEQRVNEFHEFRSEVLCYDDEYVRGWPAHDMFFKYLVGDGNDANYYLAWNKRRTQIDLKDLKKIAPGFSGSVIRAPITLDFEQMKSMP